MKRRAIEYLQRIFKVDAAIAQIPFTFGLVPFECSDAREQFLNCVVFRHSEAPRGSGCDTRRITEIRYDGFRARQSVYTDVFQKVK